MATNGTRDAAFPEPPYSFTDQAGRDHTVEVHDDDPAPLEALYEQFDDESRAQGIPPRSAERRTEWIEELLEGHNVVAWHDGTAVGHAVLLPYDDTAELAVFVHPAYQSAGVGTAIVRCLLGLGRAVGLEQVRLVVDPSNTIAVRLYRTVGFSVTDRHRGEFEMERTL